MSAIPSVILASLLWACATQIFSWIGQRLPVRRLNFYKSTISLICFLIVCLFTGNIIPSTDTISYLLISGFLGFALGDLCIFYAFSKMGSARTLMISSFAPAIIMVQSYFFLGLNLSSFAILGLFLMIACIFFLSMDKLDGIQFKWKYAGIALIGFALDAAGIVLSKKAFLISEELDTHSANLVRIFVAVVVLAVINAIQRVPFYWGDLSRKMITMIFLSSILGTFLALMLWLHAIKHGHPAIISAIGSLTPLYSSIYDYSIRRRWPSFYFFLAILFMALGIYILYQANLEMEFKPSSPKMIFNSFQFENR